MCIKTLGRQDSTVGLWNSLSGAARIQAFCYLYFRVSGFRCVLFLDCLTLEHEGTRILRNSSNYKSSHPRGCDLSWRNSLVVFHLFSQLTSLWVPSDLDISLVSGEEGLGIETSWVTLVENWISNQATIQYYVMTVWGRMESSGSLIWAVHSYFCYSRWLRGQFCHSPYFGL